MSSPEPLDPIDPAVPIQPVEPAPPVIGAVPQETEPGENPVVAWARAIVLGIGDTAKDMLAEGRRGARREMDEQWDRFDAKTKHRRGSR